MTEAISVVAFRDHTGEILDRVQGGQRYIIQRFSRPVAGLIPITDLERLEEPVSEEKAVYNIEQLAPEETARLVALFAPRLVNQLLEQCWQDKSTARRVLLAALIKLEEEP